MLTVQDLQSCPDGILTEQVEGYRFMQTFDACQMPDFVLGYLQVRRDGALISTLPYFLTTYRFDTMVTQPWLKAMLAPIKFQIACVGHPSTDIGLIDGEVSAEVLNAVNVYLFQKSKLVVYKMFAQELPLMGFSIARGLPVNSLNLADYTLQMRANRRKNIRKRLAQSASLRFEFVKNPAELPAHLMAAIFALYQQTEARADHEFEHLPFAYFLKTAPLSQYVLAFEGERLIGFVQTMTLGSSCTAKYIGMDYACNQQYGLYFSLVVKVIEDAQMRGIKTLELGPTSYYFKRLIGCSLIPTHIHYRHSNSVLNRLLGYCRFLLEPSAKELL